jgi:hypothetical protein
LVLGFGQEREEENLAVVALKIEACMIRESKLNVTLQEVLLQCNDNGQQCDDDEEGYIRKGRDL